MTGKKIVNHIVCDPHNEFQFATGYSDGTISIWDNRNNNRTLSTFQAHIKETRYLDWHPIEK